MFPKNYDWRYRVISNLLSPRDNPSHYWMAAGGLALTGLLMLPFAGYLRRHLGVIAPRTANISAGTFTAGRVERPRTKPVCRAIVLDLVVSDAVASGWNFL